MGERMETTVYNMSGLRVTLKYFYRTKSGDVGIGFYDKGGEELLPNRRKRNAICCWGVDQSVHVIVGGNIPLLTLTLDQFDNNRGKDLVLDLSADGLPHDFLCFRCDFVHPGTNPNPDPHQWIWGASYPYSSWIQNQWQKNACGLMRKWKTTVDNKSEVCLTFKVLKRVGSCSYEVPSRGRKKICFSNVYADYVHVLSGEEVLFAMIVEEVYINKGKVLLLDMLDGQVWYDFVDHTPTTLARRIWDALPFTNLAVTVREYLEDEIQHETLRPKVTVVNGTEFQLAFWGYHKIGNEARTEKSNDVYSFKYEAVPARGRRTIRPWLLVANYADYEFYKGSKFVQEIHIFGPKEMLLLVLSYRDFEDNMGMELQLTYNFMDDRLHYAFTHPIQTKSLAQRICCIG